jgi:hypothetical protein
MNKKPTVPLLIIALVLILYLSNQFNLIDLFDPANYIRAARLLAENNSMPLDNFFTGRLCVTIPIAVAMKLLGEGFEAWYFWINKGEFILLLLLVFICLKKWHEKIAWFSFLLICLSQIFEQHASCVNSDLPVSLFSNAPLLIFFYAWKTAAEDKINNPVSFGIAAGVLFMLAILAKASALLYIPLYLYLISAGM